MSTKTEEPTTKEESAIISVEKKTDSVQVNAFTQLPSTFEQAQKYCEYLASSSLVPKNYAGRPQDIFVAISWGQQTGLKNPISALNNIAVINGTPSMYGDAPLALVLSSPLCEFILEDNEAFAYARDKVAGWEHLKDKNPDDTSICVGKRVGKPVAVREFSKDDVKTAKLGNVHNSYPKDMRKYKARARLIDGLFADITQGIAQAELVKENLSKEPDPVPNELQDGLNTESNNSFAKSMSEGLKDPDKAIDEAVVVEDEQEEELPDGAQWESNKTVQDIIKSSKYLDGKGAKELNEVLTAQEGKLTVNQANGWKELIKSAHEDYKASQNSHEPNK